MEPFFVVCVLPVEGAATAARRARLLEVSTLVERCRAGDGLAWEALVRRFQGRIYGVGLHYLRNAEEARDVAQEVFVRVYRQLDRFEGGEFLPWLLRVARNACLDRLRRIKARLPLQDLPFDEGLETPDEAVSPEEAAARHERKRLLYRAMGGLSESHREILILKEIQGLKFEEVAAVLEVPVGTLKSRSNRARLELAARIRDLDPSYGSSG
jgi:RNA polymerase sigma-70 factor (ECF subfamily)